MKTSTKLEQPLPPPPWPHTTMGRKWWTDFAYQCKDIDLPFYFLLPCLCTTKEIDHIHTSEIARKLSYNTILALEINGAHGKTNGWWTDFAYPCKNIDVPFSFLLPCLCDVRLPKYYNRGDWPYHLIKCKKDKLQYHIGIGNKWNSQEDQRTMNKLYISM
jgi:hypothetical protein